MLDIKYIRANPESVAAALASRGMIAPITEFLCYDEERRALMGESEALKSQRNSASKAIGILRQQGKEATEQMEAVRLMGDSISALDEKIKMLDEKQTTMIMGWPNLPHESTPLGTSEADNLEVARVGVVSEFSYQPKNHWELGESLGLIDVERAGKVSGTRFSFMVGLGARLERAVLNYMLDLHASRGYTEVLPPYLVNSASMLGTGQLPKFADDMFHIENSDYYLIPTAEVPVTNMYRDEILAPNTLPLAYCAYSACFRAEAGAAGKDNRGLIRQHQFNKVELVKFVEPEHSMEELDRVVKDAAAVLEGLGLPYRVLALCTGDMGFCAAKTFDLEVWLPGANCYREISSCSNFLDFQARRANIRYRQDAKAKPVFLHTLNGSGLAIGRTVAAILENYQQADGTVNVPAVLQPYMGVDKIK
ncbi:MAG: serine--tRNA ligase [Clostridia bacterium]